MFAALWRALGRGASGERLKRMQASPQWQGRGFSNGLPERMHVGAMLKRYFKKSPASNGRGQVPLQAVEPGRFATAPASGLRITWFGHSSTFIEIEGMRVLIDPVWGPRASPSARFGPLRFHDNALPIDQLPWPDVVLYSHDHYDHLDESTVRAMAFMNCRYVVPLGLGAHLEYWGVPADRITEFDWWDELSLGSLKLACLPARHFSGRMLIDKNHSLWCGWALIGRDKRVYYSGDSAYFDGFAAIGKKYGPFDASLIELGSYDVSWPDVHVGPEQAVRTYQDLQGGGLFLPVHWGTFDLALHSWTEPVERLILAADAAKVPLCIPRPGTSIETSTPPPLERWWPELPFKNAAEEPIVSSEA